jgi:hypothetical protein
MVRKAMENTTSLLTTYDSIAGKSTIYIHQSGASVLSDNSLDDTFNNKVDSDETPSELDALADNAPHRQIDLGDSINQFIDGCVC